MFGLLGKLRLSIQGGGKRGRKQAEVDNADGEADDADMEFDGNSKEAIIQGIVVKLKSRISQVKAEPSYNNDQGTVDIIDKIEVYIKAVADGETGIFAELLAALPRDGVKALNGITKNRNPAMWTAALANQLVKAEMQTVVSKRAVIKHLPVLLQNVVALLYGMRYIKAAGRADHKQFELDVEDIYEKKTEEVGRASAMASAAAAAQTPPSTPRAGGILSALLQRF